MEVSGDEFYQRVHDGYRLIAEKEPGRYVIVDGTRAVDIGYGNGELGIAIDSSDDLYVVLRA